jgi:ATP-dependent DNA ligase
MATIIPMNTHEVRRIPQIACMKSDVEGIAKAFMREKPTAEGMVIRDANGKFEPGKRTWCYQKYVPRPTIDLRVVDFEEATTEAGEPKGMVGRVIVSYKGKEIGCGPGKLTHAERTILWNDFTVWGIDCLETPIATIQYKEDASYEALREPTFQHWRDDKDTPDA